MSHTKVLIDEAMLQINDYLQKERDKGNKGSKDKHRRTNINKFTEKFGVHLMRTSDWSKRETMSAFGKLSSIKFYTLASVNPQLFDEFYEMCSKMMIRKKNTIGTLNTELLILF